MTEREEFENFKWMFESDYDRKPTNFDIWQHQQKRINDLQSENKTIDAINAGLQQRLALKDREIMRLREALEEIVKKENTEENEWDAVEVVIPAICTIAKQALSTPTTYDDLMAWHNEQLGEPVAISKEWVGLSDEEIFALCPYIDHDLLEEAFYRGAEAIEAKLKELNNDTTK